jgi:GNAT superfamily N-acetyltransferase
MTLLTRAAREADIPALVELLVDSYRTSFSSILGAEGLKLRGSDFFRQRLENEWPHLIVAEVPAGENDGGILGLAEVRSGTLDMLFVRPGGTSQGVGSLLLAEAERLGAVRLECFARNIRALAFYQRQGWTPVRRYSRAFAGADHSFVALEKPYIASFAELRRRNTLKSCCDPGLSSD